MAWSGRPVLSWEDLRREAAEFLDTYHAEGTIPIPIAEIVEFDFELEIIPVEGIKDELRVDAFLTSDLTSIYIDEYVLTHVPNRYRFSLAHELGHYWLHQDLYEANRIRSVQDYRNLQAEIGQEDYRWLEWQANAFAGLILVPQPQLTRVYEQRLRQAQEVGVTKAQLHAFPARQSLIRAVATAFEVSEDVASIRLEKDNHLPPLAGRE